MYIPLNKQNDLHTNVNKSYPEAAVDVHFVALEGAKSFK